MSYDNSQQLAEALREALRALNVHPRFRVQETNSYAIASLCQLGFQVHPTRDGAAVAGQARLRVEVGTDKLGLVPQQTYDNVLYQMYGVLKRAHENRDCWQGCQEPVARK